MVVGEFTQETDLVVIGGGPAGYSAAFRAAELGVQTLIVDAHPSNALGGVCLHEGCIPSKTLLHIAETIHLAEKAGEFGVKYAKPKINHSQIRAWVDKAVAQLATGLESRAKKLNIERVQGIFRFDDSRNLSAVEGPPQRIRFRRAVIATGSTPHVNSVLPFDGVRILTPQQAVRIESVPKSVLIVGHNYMAVELAQIFAALGSNVTLTCEGHGLLPECDPDLLRPLLKSLRSHVTAIHMNLSMKEGKIDEQGVRITFAGDQSPPPANYDLVVVCGRHAGNIRSLHLESTSVKFDADQFIQVDSQMRTTDARVFAVGDVTGPPLLADRALFQGRIAGEVIAGRNIAFDTDIVPFAIFTDPQIAWCGLNQPAADQYEVTSVKIPWGASGRAVGMGRADGLTKIIFDPESKIVLGVGMVGPHSCELIAEAALAIEMGATLTDLAHTIHPHPTMSELLSEAARSIMER